VHLTSLPLVLLLLHCCIGCFPQVLLAALVCSMPQGALLTTLLLLVLL
jgi:hypothetical protein